ncbi:LysR family transcriptional regulator [Vibrio sp. PP-XX7]
MRLEKLDLNLLVVLESLLETQSVSQTAQELNVSQPTISAALKRLRAYFDDELLIPAGRVMMPTPKEVS